MVLARRAAGNVGTKLIITCLICMSLTGCTGEVKHVPYVTTDMGTMLTPSQYNSSKVKQVLEWCTGPYEPLYKGELNYYYGSLCALSNYRALLLSSDFTETSVEKTSDLLDCMLSNGSERVRLIYQSTGTIRILFENSDGLAHILLEGM